MIEVSKPVEHHLRHVSDLTGGTIAELDVFLAVLESRCDRDLEERKTATGTRTNLSYWSHLQENRVALEREEWCR